jgi:hypothetical protein
MSLHSGRMGRELPVVCDTDTAARHEGDGWSRLSITLTTVHPRMARSMQNGGSGAEAADRVHSCHPWRDQAHSQAKRCSTSVRRGRSETPRRPLLHERVPNAPSGSIGPPAPVLGSASAPLQGAACAPACSRAGRDALSTRRECARAQWAEARRASPEPPACAGAASSAVRSGHRSKRQAPPPQPQRRGLCASRYPPAGSPPRRRDGTAVRRARGRAAAAGAP